MLNHKQKVCKKYKKVQERWNPLHTPIVREINPVFEEKIVQQSHVSLGALKEEFSAKVDLWSARLHWSHEVELSPKVDLRSDGLQRNPEAEISCKMRQNHSKRESKQCNSTHYSRENSMDSRNSDLVTTTTNFSKQTYD